MAKNTPTDPMTDLSGSLDELDSVVGFLSSDKSNDWTEELATLAKIDTNARAAIEELKTLREEVEAWRANLGTVDDVVTTSRYARIGRQAAVTLGANQEWRSSDITGDLSTYWSAIASPEIGGQSPEALAHWRELADHLGIRHDGEPE